MPWSHDQLTAVDTLLFKSKRVKVGRFECRADHPCFPVSKSLDNDVFVMPKMPVWVRRDDGEYRFAEPGGILMHRAGQTLARRRVAVAGDCTYWFGVHPDIFVSALQHYELPTEEMGGALIVDARLRYRLALFLKRLEGGSTEYSDVEGAVLKFFYEICAQRVELKQSFSESRHFTVQRQRRLVDLSRAYLDAHLSERVSLETVAEAVGTSLYHLCRVFRERMGITMHAYRTRQRLWRVLDHLVDGAGGNLAELAFDQGFSSHSHLCRIFQKQMGVSPSSIRSVSLAAL